MNSLLHNHQSRKPSTQTHKRPRAAHLRDVVQSSLALLLLQLEGDAAHGSALDPLHEVGDESGDLVAHALGGHDGDLVEHALVGVEVHVQPRVVFLDDMSGGPLDGLVADSLRAQTSGESG